MDLNQNKRRQSLKIIVSEAIMVVAVIFMVVVLAFIVSGYWVNPDLKIERQGLLQVSSIPTGAEVEIDGASSWLQKTNTSKVLTSGQHTIKLSKEGYDTWSKDINISEGLLYRLSYPRLFLQNREKETVLKTADVAIATVSPNRETMLLIGNTTKMSTINLKEETLQRESFDVADYFPTTSSSEDPTQNLLAGQILDYRWDKTSAHVLFKVLNNSVIEWILLDVVKPTNSINLTKSFGANFDAVRIIDDAANLFLATQNGNLHKINLASKSISAVLAEGVTSFDYYHDKVVFSRYDESSQRFQVGLLELSGHKTTGANFRNFGDFAAPPQVAIGKFYEDQYIVIATEQTLSLSKIEDSTEIGAFETTFLPEQIKIGHDGEFVLVYNDQHFATIDMESSRLTEWTTEDPQFGWLDNYMIYTIINGQLTVRDYDGFNLRVLASSADSKLPATITNDKWLYYFGDDALVREWLIPR